MKGNQIDDLFRLKLSHQKTAPPPSAWSSVEQNLPKKNKKGTYFWMSIAASIMVILTAGWLLIGQGEDAQVTGPETLAETKKPSQPKESVAAEQPVETLVAEEKTTAPALKQIDEPQMQQFVAQTRKPIKEYANAVLNEVPNPEALTVRVRFDLELIEANSRPTELMTASQFKFDMIMPLDVTAFYVPYTEDLELAPRKKKFRVINGIISVAKGVNSGKLSFQELRNAKNNFIVEDLNYGSKEEGSDSGEDDDPQTPEKE